MKQVVQAASGKAALQQHWKSGRTSHKQPVGCLVRHSCLRLGLTLIP
jgi:hypothetical protein